MASISSAKISISIAMSRPSNSCISLTLAPEILDHQYDAHATPPINQPPVLKSCFLSKILYKNHHPGQESEDHKSTSYNHEPMESDGIHEILRPQSYQIQLVSRLKSNQNPWNLMGSMRYQLSNLIISKILWLRVRLFRGKPKKTLQGLPWPSGGWFINPVLALKVSPCKRFCV